MKVRNTLVVWVLDQTSGSQVRTDAASAAALFHRDAGKPIPKFPEFDQVQWWTDQARQFGVFLAKP